MYSRKKVLVVEDNMLNRELLCGILATKYEVLEAENGQEALETVRRYKEGISIILLDIVMPVMDGYTFLSIVKADAELSSIPVIVATQSDGESDEVAALSHGATDFVAKPYKPQVILHRVASIINLRETAAVLNLMQYDRLTGLYSKEFFFQKVKEMLMQNPDTTYDIVCSDIENFKLINDVFGVSTGDRLLRGIGKMYEESVEGNGICGRLNSDLFACIIEHRSLTDDLFIASSAQINHILDVRNIVMKWGVYTVTDRTLSVEQMCDRALLAARSIKGQYGKYFSVYDDALRDKLLKDQAITDSMETALTQGQFQIYLQPKYRIEDETLVGAEALVRWIHPEWGVQSPAEFIPLFEKNGFITKLDQYVWDRACAALRDFDDRGFAPVSVSVNVSRADIYNADLADILMKTVKKYDLPPARLHLEITESAYTENPKQIIDTVRRLRELGFVIEMDDFGSGYSSLNMLNEMPIDILKLDMKFIQSETAKPTTKGILQFIIGLARWMHLSVVAEGVETKEQLMRLKEIGCDFVQGYYFAKPMPCNDFEALIQDAVIGETSLGRAGAELPQKELPVVLVADEDANNRSELRKVAAGHYQVAGVENCEDAFAYIHRHKNLAALVLSLTLPGPDGFAVLKEIQQEKALWNLPVIATAKPDPELESKAFDLGADDFIARPHKINSLLCRIQKAVSAARDKENLRFLRSAAYKDHLTGLLNRRGMKNALKDIGKNDLPVAVCLFDLDDLKQCNDAYGHAKGDGVLMRFVKILRANTREADVLGRIGGDEFAAVFRRVDSNMTAARMGEQVCAAARKATDADGVGVSCSGGVAVLYPGGDIKEVMEQADKALYTAKRQKKGSCCLWNEEQK